MREKPKQKIMYVCEGCEETSPEMCGQEIKEPPQPKWPGRVTSSNTECSHDKCIDVVACRKGCIHQRPITWADAPEVH